MDLRIVTLCNDETADQLVFLRQSCLEHGLQLEVLGHGVKWTRNALKFRLLADYLNKTGSEDALIMVVDAFDVIVSGGAEEIIPRFREFNADIVFSAEANYYFREPDLSLYYWWYYPRREDTIYHYLNSGTFIGTHRALKSLLQRISEVYEVDYNDDHQIEQVRSDQYLYSRFFADYKLNVVQTDFVMELDAFQELFACSGGRMAAAAWPQVSWIQDYLFFKYERRMLKTFGMKEAQDNCRDLRFNKRSGSYRNTFSTTEPPVIHLPGTYSRFGHILKKLRSGFAFSGWDLIKPLAFFISLIAFLRSVANASYIQLVNKDNVDLKDIFPVILNSNDRVKPGTELMTHLESNKPFFYKLKRSESKLLPWMISRLREKKLGMIREPNHSPVVLERLGLRFNTEIIDTGNITAESISRTFEDEDAVLVTTPGIPEQKLKQIFNSFENITIIDISDVKYFGQSGSYFPKDNPFTS